MPVLAKDKTRIGLPSTYVRDDRPFGGPYRPLHRTFRLSTYNNDYIA